jgi:hypothetical protein
VQVFTGALSMAELKSLLEMLEGRVAVYSVLMSNKQTNKQTLYHPVLDSVQD